MSVRVSGRIFSVKQGGTTGIFPVPALFIAGTGFLFFQEERVCTYWKRAGAPAPEKVFGPGARNNETELRKISQGKAAEGAALRHEKRK